MPLVTPELPKGFERLIGIAVREMAPPPPASFNTLVFGGPEELQPTLPQRVFSIDPVRLVNGAKWSDFVQVGWRVLILHGEDPWAAVDFVSVDPKAEPTEADISVVQGPEVAATVEVIGDASKLPALKKGQYEICLLDLPALYITAIWFRSQTSSIFVVLNSVSTRFTPKAFVDSEKFLSLLADEARERLAKAKSLFDVSTGVAMN